MPELNLLTPAEAVYWANHLTRMSGTEVAPRGEPTLEVQNVTFHIRYPWLSPYLPEREAREAIGAVEALQLVGQVADPDTTTTVSKTMANYTDGGIFHGAYGARVYGQLSRVATLLQNDPATRQAVVTIYDGPRDLLATQDGLRGVRDIPCTLSLQFLWAGDRLSLRTSMRSNDVWLGLPYDLFQFTALQMAMADALGVRPGPYVHTVGSLHLYERDMAASGRLRAPSEPEAHLTTYLHPRWGGGSIAETSARARAILAGRPIDHPTPFETDLISAMEAAR